MVRNNLRRGATLIEVIITTGVFSVLMLTLFSIVQYGKDAWRSVEGRQVTQTMMRKVGIFTMDDLRRASFSNLGVANYTNYLPSNSSCSLSAGNENVQSGKNGMYGQAIWMTSAYLPGQNTAEGAAQQRLGGNQFFSRNQDGTPNWHSNILYYVSVMTDKAHIEKYHGGIQDLCGGEQNCPHKWLIRKEIYNAPSLLSKEDIGKYLVQAGAKDFFKADGKVKTQVLADCIVAFQVVVEKPSVVLVIKSARLEELNRYLTVTRQSLGGTVTNDEGTLPVSGDSGTYDAQSNSVALKRLDTLAGATGRAGAYTLQYDITVVPGNE